MQIKIDFSGSSQELQDSIQALRHSPQSSELVLPQRQAEPQIPEVPEVVVQALHAQVAIAQQTRADMDNLVRTVSELVRSSVPTRTASTSTIEAEIIAPPPLPPHPAPVTREALISPTLVDLVTQAPPSEIIAPPPIIPVSQDDDLVSRPVSKPVSRFVPKAVQFRTWLVRSLAGVFLLSMGGALLGMALSNSVIEPEQPRPNQDKQKVESKPSRSKVGTVSKRSRPNSDNLVLSTDKMFEGGSNSLVAKAVGSAEGTRTPDGAKTWAYYGHTDPGNGVWNLGSFSYQHGASSPDDADRKQLNRLQRQFEVIERSASSKGLRLGLEEQLNGLDLANQAPLAALDRGGYVDRLYEFRSVADPFRRILKSRSHAFINPATGELDAPGLGNNWERVTSDQERRMIAIRAAIEAYKKEMEKKKK